MKYQYPSEKLSAARRCLMLPHPRGEAQSIADAFFACSLLRDDLETEDLDEDARGWWSTIRKLMDTTGIEDPNDRRTWRVKAEGFTEDQKFELTASVDELASWLDREFWSAASSD